MVSREDAAAVYVGANAVVGVGAAAAAMSDPAGAAAAAGTSLVLAGLIASTIAFATLARSGALDPSPGAAARRIRRTVALALAVAAFVPALLGSALPAAGAVRLAATVLHAAAPLTAALL